MFGRSDAGGGRAGARGPTQPLGTRGTGSPGGNHLPDLLLANDGSLVQALHNSLHSKVKFPVSVVVAGGTRHL